MPRVKLNNTKYKRADFTRWIRSEMAQRELNQQVMGEALGVSQQGFSKKLRGCQFTYSEILTIFQLFQTSDEQILRVMKGNFYVSRRD